MFGFIDVVALFNVLAVNFASGYYFTIPSDFNRRSNKKFTRATLC